MDAMHGEGTSERMHEAMGPDAEALMDQCVAMMNMMSMMMGTPAMGEEESSMMGGSMMRSMMGR